MLWFFVVAAALSIVAVSAAELRSAGMVVLLPVWIVGSMLFRL